MERGALEAARPAADGVLRRGLSTLGCAELSLDAALRLGARHGVRCFELRGLGGSLDLPAQLARECGTPAGFAARVRRAGAEIVALDTSAKLMGGTRAEREALGAVAPWADAVGARWLRVFDGGAALDDAALSEAAEMLAWWRGVRKENGWAAELMIETHDLLLDAARIGRFLAAMPGHSPAILWDAHHTWRKGGEDPVATWRGVGSHVVHIHVKDSRANVDAAMGWRYGLPGAGEFPMARLLAALEADRYAGVVSLEWERRWHPELPPLEEALRAAQRARWW